jgi:hypothetical protein
MRQRYIQDRETLQLVPVDADYIAEPKASGMLLIPDIQPYRSMQTGEMIQGRMQHREHLRRHNLIEIGNEYVKPKPLPKVPGLKQAVVENYQRLRAKNG